MLSCGRYNAQMRCARGFTLFLCSQNLFQKSVKNIDFLSVLPFSLRISGNQRIGVARFEMTAGEEIAEILLHMAQFGSESFLEEQFYVFKEVNGSHI
ncbi:MAG: hypothetical protein LBB12_04125 [Holosporaceae bacterium]|jgi:hypothetical protein|nr:hypothetical protein [Holosporaceae bacterium]